MNKTYKIGALLCSLTLILGLFGGYVLASSPTVTTWLQPGSLAETANTVIWIDGTTYFSKDGETGKITDSTNASYLINSAVDNNTLIFLRSGVYQISTHILMDMENCSLVGSGFRNTVLNMTVAMDELIYIEGLYCQVSDLCLEGNWLEANGIWIDGYSGGGGANILHNYVTHFDGYSCVQNGEPAAAVLKGNKFLENDKGVALVATSDCLVTENEIGAVRSSECLSLASTTHNIISNNFIYLSGYDAETSTLTGVAWAGVSCYLNFRETLENNRIQSCGGEGVLLTNATEISILGGTCSYNNINSDARAGIGLNGNSSYNLISGVHFYNDPDPAPGYEWYAYQTYGVLEQGTADYNSITSCNAWDMVTAGFIQSGANSEFHSCFNGTTWIT